MSCYTEMEIAAVALEIIRQRPGIRTSELIEVCRARMHPTGEDTEILANRNDDKFSQKVRNIKSHDSIANQVFTEGKVDRKWYIR